METNLGPSLALGRLLAASAGAVLRGMCNGENVPGRAPAAIYAPVAGCDDLERGADLASIPLLRYRR